jgi:CubicO group peptidase (beta-lactamase class C family)
VTTHVAERIERVISGLLPETPWQGRYGEPARLEERMHYHRTPGVSIAVIADGRLEWARGFGVRTTCEAAPVADDTLFQAASISKPVFALAVMRLVAQGRLDLDADVNEYLASWKLPANDGWRPRVTLRQLLSHRAGLTVHGFPGFRHDEPLPSVPQILDGAPPANTGPVRVNLLPGTQFRYAGGGTTVAQQAVMDVLGLPFAEIMRTLVLDPLGMHTSTYEQPLPEGRRGAAATGHPWKGEPLPGGWYTYPEQAAAGLWTTPSDLVRLGLGVQAALRSEREDWLPSSLVREMLTPQADEHMEIGFFLEGKDEHRRFGHGGWNEGFLSELKVYQTQGLGAAVMINSNQGQPLLGKIMRAIARAYEWPGYEEDASQPVEVQANMQDFVGVYHAEQGFTARVREEGVGLVLVAGNQDPISLQPRSAGARVDTGRGSGASDLAHATRGGLRNLNDRDRGEPCASRASGHRRCLCTWSGDRCPVHRQGVSAAGSAWCLRPAVLQHRRDARTCGGDADGPLRPAACWAARRCPCSAPQRERRSLCGTACSASYSPGSPIQTTARPGRTSSWLPARSAVCTMCLAPAMCSQNSRTIHGSRRGNSRRSYKPTCQSCASSRVTTARRLNSIFRTPSRFLRRCMPATS